MPIVTREVFMCDRCGAEASADEETKYHWQRISNDWLLCPKCHSGYAAIRDRHLTEIENYINMR